MAGLLEMIADAEVPTEEIRFGVVLNGGVSLAVWMGGTVLELDRLVKAGSTLQAHRRTQPVDGVYRTLLQLAGCTARADVVAGTSAGGINGAALALSQVNAAARMSSLRDIWVEEGRIESLLRQPFRGAPTSLLKGDEFFLPQLGEALARLARPGRADEIIPRDEAPLDLTITTTVLGGNQTVTVDSMGQQLPQRIHAGRFHWRRAAEADGPDPFDARNIARTAHRLALASRSTASFPIAFEPSFVPVGSPTHVEPGPGEVPSEEQRLHPDMSGVVESWGKPVPGRDRSRFVVDGGLLANTPTRSALQAVEAMPAAGPVRRVMLLIYPHAAPPTADPAADPSSPPTVTGEIAGLMDALTAQGSRTFVDELEDHNRTAAGRRGTRGDILKLYVSPIAGEPAPSGTPAPRATLEELTRTIYPQYRQIRLWRTARDLAARATRRQGEDTATSALPEGWNDERVRRAAQTAQTVWELPPHARVVPYVPLDPPVTPLAHDVVTPGWAWGVTTALGVAEAAGDLLRRMIWAMPRDTDYTRVLRARQKVSTLTGELRRMRERFDGVWEKEVLGSLMPDEAYWRLRLAAYARAMLGRVDPVEVQGLINDVADAEARLIADSGDAQKRHRDVSTALWKTMAGTPGETGEAVRDRVGRIVGWVDGVLDVLDRYADAGTSMDGYLVELSSWRALLRPATQPAHPALTHAELLTRLLQLEVAATTLGDEVRTGTTLPLEVVQLSARTENAFAEFTRTGDAKLGGMSLHRFGGFLKRSWRVNDWTWGRVDAATVLCRIVLHPARVRRAAVLSGYLGAPPRRTGDADADAAALRKVHETAVESAEETAADLVDRLFVPGQREHPRIADLRDRARQELERAFDLGSAVEDLDAAMPALADLFAWALQLDLVAGELPALARAIRADSVEGANQRSRGALFLAENEALLGRLESREPGGPAGPDDRRRRAADDWAALEAFDRGSIGAEPLAEEGSSDQMIRTATTAAAVAATVVDSDRSGLGPVRAVTRPLRGAALLPYWLIMGLSSKTVLARSLALLGLALGGVLLALSLFGVLPDALSGPAAAIGAGALLAAFAFGAMRTGTILHGLVLFTPIVPLTAYAVSASRQQPVEQGLGVLLVVAALVVGMMILGSLPAANGSVFAALDRLAERERVRGVWAGHDVRGLRRLLRPLVRRGLALLVAAARQLPTVAVVAAVAGLAWWLADERWKGVLLWCQKHDTLLAVLSAAAVVVGSLAAYALGRQLQILRPSVRVEDGRPRTVWDFQNLVHPAGATAGWSVLYGAGYLTAACVLSAKPEWAAQTWLTALLLTSLALGVVLVLLVPFGLPVRAIRRTYTAERDRAVAAVTGTPEPAVRTATQAAAARRRLADDLTSRGLSYRCFVDGRSAAPPELRALGRRLDRRIAARRRRNALIIAGRRDTAGRPSAPG